MESRFLNEGFFAYVTKPVQAKKLEETIASALALASVPITKTILHTDSWVTSEMIEEHAHRLALYNISLEDGLLNANGDISLLASMSEIFVKNNETTIARTKALTDAQAIDFDELHLLAHSLKSNAGYVGATDLSYHAKLVEKGCKNRDSQIVKLTIPLLCFELENTLNALSAFATNVHAAEPCSDGSLSEQAGKTQCFQPEKLINCIENGMRTDAIEELNLLIAEKGTDCAEGYFEAKREIQEYNFDRALQILSNMGISAFISPD
jgi:HPt (histidine-containing phosphotransfer) domain-containing protein